MRHIKIIGAGGFALELTKYISDNNKVLDEKIIIDGYLDINDDLYKKNKFDAPFLGNEQEFSFNVDDEVLIAVGDKDNREKILKHLEEKKVKVGSFFHHTSFVAIDSNKLGIGNIVCPSVIIGPVISIGSYNLINYQCTIPHHCIIGNNNVFSPNVHLTGYTEIGNSNFFGVSAGTVPNIKIGNNNKIQAGLIVSKNINNNSIVFTTTKVKSMEIYK